MKRLFMLLFVAVAFAACEQAPVEEQSAICPDVPETITVGFEGEDTRIQLNDAQKTVWTNGDLVSVFYRSDANQKWQYTGETGARTAELKRVDAGTATHDMDRVVVVYPYNADYYINPSTYNVQASLPAVQTYLEDSYGLNGNIMISQGEYNQFSLKSVCGWLKLQLTGNGEKVKSITLRGNNGEQVAGELYINSADATSILASDSGASDDDSEAGGSLIFEDTILTEVTLDCGDGVTLGAEATAFYIALPPQTFDGGITVEIATTDGATMTKSTDNSIVIERNHIQPMTTFVYDGVRPQPNNEIWYTATEKVEPYDKTAFGATYVSNEWDSETGKGVITFEGDVTKIGEWAFLECRSLTSVTIPDSVTTIGEFAFGTCRSLTSVTIPDSVTTIGEAAFARCSSLTSVTIPDSVTTIGERAFVYCTSLKEFKGKFAADGGRCLIIDGVLNAFAIGCGVTQYTIPDSVTTIGYAAFDKCASLTSVTIPDSVTTIGGTAFYECNSLTSVTIPDSVTTIGEWAFADCTSLTSVTIGDSVTTIGEWAFAYCNSFKTVYCKPTTPPAGGDSMFAYNAAGLRIFVPASDDDSIINAYKEADGWSHYKYYIFEEEPKPANNEIWYTATEKVEPYKTDEFGATYLTNVWDSETGKGVITFEGNVTKIGYYAFYDCTSLTSVTIGNSVTTIGNYAFHNCSRLTSVTIGNSVTTIGNYTFHNCSSLTSVTIPDSVTTIGERAFEYCSSLTSVTIPESVTEIGNLAFYYCTSLTSVTIPDSVTTIGKRAFAYCSSLTSVTIPDSVTTIGEDTFRDCTSLTSVTIPDSVTTIGDYAFSYCDSLTSVTIPDSVTTIGEEAFSNCTSLTSVTIGNSVTTIGNYAFCVCDSLTSVTIPDSVTTIGEAAFAWCKSLTGVTIPDSVTTIGDMAFSSCSSLKEFKGKFAADGGRCLIIDGVLNAFAIGCGVTQYTIPDSVTTIGYSAFDCCISLTSVTIPDSVTTIGSYAFYECNSLTSVTIPDSVTTIGDAAFYSCYSLKTVYCKPTTPPVGGYDMFYDNAAGRRIFVPASDDDSIINTYKKASGWSEYKDYIFEEE